MCGIVGVASSRPVAASVPLARMRDALRHRGPDEEGLWWSADGRCGLAHRRLAVLDLSATGRQPMADAEGTLHLSYNGEIYNHRALRDELAARGHRFRGGSDSEVVLAAYREWDTGCLERFDGMFAFALHDAARDRLFLARDRIGEKPLFLRHDEGALAFASELKALLADPSCPRRLELPALDFYLAYGYVPGARSILQGFQKLPPAHGLIYEPRVDRVRTWRYWSLPEPPPERAAITEAQQQDRLEALLAESVRLRLAADVPVGVLLSGGIDSSLVTALAARSCGSRLRTFTVSVPGDAEHDEAPFARLVARHFGTEHTEVVAEPASLDLLPELARQYDEPMADSSMVPSYLLSRAVGRHGKVALGGDGGDELFGGYPHYNWLRRADALRRILPAPARRWLGAAASRVLPPGTRGRNHLIGLAGDAAHGIAHVNLYFDRSLRRRLLRLPLPEDAPPPEAWRASLVRPGLSPLQQATRADLLSTLPEAYLVKIDRASMLASLEVRSPWLDHRLVEFAFRLPDELRCGPEGRKRLPKRLARKLLPSGLPLERKQGLTMPFDRWLREGEGAIAAILDEADPQLFDRGVVRELLRAERRGYRNAQRLFALAFFQLWQREYGVGL